MSKRGPAAGGRGGRGSLAAGRRQPGSAPQARGRTGAGRCRHAVSPAPARLAVPAVTHPGDRARQEQPGCPPAPGILVAAKAPSQGRSGLRPPRPLLRKRKPLTASFPGKIGSYREDGRRARLWRFGVTITCGMHLLETAHLRDSASQTWTRTPPAVDYLARPPPQPSPVPAAGARSERSSCE